jgi:FAD synthase
MGKTKIAGRVIKGDGFARQLNFPTANIDIKIADFGLETGVYAGKAKLKDVDFDAAIIIKKNPDKVEAHLFSYAGGDFYNEDLEIFNLIKISEIERVTGQSLQEKVYEDIKKIKNKLGIK